MGKIKVGLFDDHPFTAKGLKQFLKSNSIEVEFCCQKKENLFDMIESTDIDILILDIVVPDVTGLEIFENVILKYPAINIIAYSSLSSAMLIENLLIIGVKGYVNKIQNENDILNCVKAVYKNQISIPDKYLFLTSKFRILNSNILTTREIEILKLISAEFTSQQIAENLRISIFTVENHRKSIFRKLKVKNLAGMVLAANRLGYIS